MSTSRSLRVPVPGLARGLLAALVVLPVASAQFLYQLDDTGKVFVNGTLIDKLPGGFDPGDLSSSQNDEVWWDAAVSGSDRYAIRIDGQVQKNGVKIDTLPVVTGEGWIAITVDDEGEWWALRSDGMLANEGSLVFDHEDEGEYIVDDEVRDEDFAFNFTDLVADGGDLYALREDACIFRNTTLAPFAKLIAGDGVGPAGVFGEGTADKYGEGTSEATAWREMVISGSTLFAIRRDGHIVSLDLAGDGDPPAGTLLSNLPPDLESFGQANDDVLYRGITVDDGGDWFALRGDGSLFSPSSQVDPLVDLPGKPSSGINQNYMDVVWTPEGLFTLRLDGKLYKDLETDPVLDAPQSRHRRLAYATDDPDLTNVKNSKPTVVGYKVTVNEGQALTLPVIVQDLDQSADAAIVTHDADTVPPGATWNAVDRQLEWASAGPAGKYKFRVFVDDGAGTKPRKATFSIRVLGPDTNLTKNKPPVGSKIKKATPFVGLTYVLPIIVADPDGDAVTVSVDPKTPLPDGATFDAGTNTLTWDAPTLLQIGKQKIRFLLDDGEKVRKLNVSLKVVSSLLGF